MYFFFNFRVLTLCRISFNIYFLYQLSRIVPVNAPGAIPHLRLYVQGAGDGELRAEVQHAAQVQA